jgi:hypothetical protein
MINKNQEKVLIKNISISEDNGIECYDSAIDHISSNQNSKDVNMMNFLNRKQQIQALSQPQDKPLAIINMSENSNNDTARIDAMDRPIPKVPEIRSSDKSNVILVKSLSIDSVKDKMDVVSPSADISHIKINTHKVGSANSVNDESRRSVIQSNWIEPAKNVYTNLSNNKSKDSLQKSSNEKLLRKVNSTNSSLDETRHSIVQSNWIELANLNSEESVRIKISKDTLSKSSEEKITTQDNNIESDNSNKFDIYNASSEVEDDSPKVQDSVQEIKVPIAVKLTKEELIANVNKLPSLQTNELFRYI